MSRPELPVFNTCCFCIPLRLGLLVMGYIKLTVAAILFCPIIFLFFLLYAYVVILPHDPDIVMNSIHFWTFCSVIVMDIIFSIFFLIAAHSKRRGMLTVYYRYSIFMIFGWLTLMVISVGIDLRYNSKSEFFYAKNIVVLVIGTVNLALQIFLTATIRSEIIKIRSNCKFRFVNEEEGQCTLESGVDTLRNDEEVNKTEENNHIFNT